MITYIQLQFSQRHDETWVRIDEGSLGQTEGLFRQPFTAPQAAAQLENAGMDSEYRPVLVALGKELFAALNQAGAGEALRVAVDKARAAQGAVLLQLRFDEGAVSLASLPWELLHDGRRHLLAAGAVDMTRYITYRESVVPIAVEAPLRVLHLGASPKDLPLLDTAVSQAAMQRIPGLTVETLARPTYDALLERMAGRPWPHIFHFDGHGLLEGDQVCICFEKYDGNTDQVDVDALQNILYNRVALVVLNACQSAALVSSMTSLFQAMAPALIQAGIPAVVGMQFPLSDQSAVRFINAFYGTIARGETLTTAMADARRWLYREGTWHIPTLYLRSSDPEGVLLRQTKDRNAGRPYSGPGKDIQKIETDVGTLRAEVEALQELLGIHRRNLHILHQQAAVFGAGAVPLYLVNQIRHEEQAIEEIEGKLAQTEDTP